MANITVTHTFTNGTAADATEVNTNFTDIINGTSDGTKDFSINALTVAGAAQLNGNVTLGNATGDNISFTGRVATDIDPATTATYAFGSTTLTWTAIFLDNGATDGGAIYFNASATAFIKSDASAGDLDISGFTDVDFNSVNLKGSGNLTFTGTLSNDGAAVFNESGADVDFRVEGDTDVNLFFVDASTDRVGISTNAPGATLDVDGSAIFNESGADVDFRIEGDTDTDLFFVDASTDRVGVSTNSPVCTFEIGGRLQMNGAAVTGTPATTDGNVFCGTYTPTMTGATITENISNYIRIGNVVIVTVNWTANLSSSTDYTITCTLPVASNFTSVNDAWGTGTVHRGSTIHAIVGRFIGDTANDRMTGNISMDGTGSGAEQHVLQFMYLVK